MPRFWEYTFDRDACGWNGEIVLRHLSKSRVFSSIDLRNIRCGMRDKEGKLDNRLTFRHNRGFNNTSGSSVGLPSNLRCLSSLSASSSCGVRFKIDVADVAVTGRWKEHALARNDGAFTVGFGSLGVDDQSLIRCKSLWYSEIQLRPFWWLQAASSCAMLWLLLLHFL